MFFFSVSLLAFWFDLFRGKRAHVAVICPYVDDDDDDDFIWKYRAKLGMLGIVANLLYGRFKLCD